MKSWVVAGLLLILLLSACRRGGGGGPGPCPERSSLRVWNDETDLVIEAPEYIQSVLLFHTGADREPILVELPDCAIAVPLDELGLSVGAYFSVYADTPNGYTIIYSAIGGGDGGGGSTDNCPK